MASMKTLYLLLISFILSSFSGIRVSSSLIDENLKGKVKRVTEYNTEVTTSEHVRYCKSVSLFDENGNETVSSVYDTNESLTIYYRNQNIYDEKGRIIQINVYDRQTNLTDSTILVYNYDYLSEIQKFSKTLVERDIYKYQTKGHSIKCIYYTGEKIDYIIIRKYNTQNKLMEDLGYDDSSRINRGYKYCYKYDNIGCLVEVDEKFMAYNKAGQINVITKYSNYFFDAKYEFRNKPALQATENYDTVINNTLIFYVPPYEYAIVESGATTNESPWSSAIITGQTAIQTVYDIKSLRGTPKGNWPIASIPNVDRTLLEIILDLAVVSYIHMSGLCTEPVGR
jgi:hypothetical protein